jgi:hypothetical protein
MELTKLIVKEMMIYFPASGSQERAELFASQVAKAKYAT